MSTNVKRDAEQFRVKRYKIQYPISAYTFPRETQIQRIRFDNEYLHIELTDGRVLSVPLKWIPTLQNVSLKEREKYELSRDRTMIIWDPAKCAINDEIRISDYLVAPGRLSISKQIPQVIRRQRRRLTARPVGSRG